MVVFCKVEKLFNRKKWELKVDCGNRKKEMGMV